MQHAVLNSGSKCNAQRLQKQAHSLYESPVSSVPTQGTVTFYGGHKGYHLTVPLPFYFSITVCMLLAPPDWDTRMHGSASEEGHGLLTCCRSEQALWMLCRADVHVASWCKKVGRLGCLEGPCRGGERNVLIHPCSLAVSWEKR